MSIKAFLIKGYSWYKSDKSIWLPTCVHEPRQKNWRSHILRNVKPKLSWVFTESYHSYVREKMSYFTEKKGELLWLVITYSKFLFMYGLLDEGVTVCAKHSAKKVYLICFTCKVIWWKRKSKAVIWKHGFNLVS